MCSWSEKSAGDILFFYWSRKSAESLQSAGYVRTKLLYVRDIAMSSTLFQETPSGDHTSGSATDYFMFVSAQFSVQSVPATSELYSEFIKGSDHPKECFMFWFQMKVIH